ncbi:MAG: hypothetical protein ABEH64_11550 [Salinirussus sp.]
MDESSRRGYIVGIGASLAGLLAGCTGRAPVADPRARGEADGEKTPSNPEPVSTPSAPENPRLEDRLPDPAAVGGRYTFGAFRWTRLREANLARGTLRPGRFVPGALQDILPDTEYSLTINTGQAAGGTLHGSYAEGTVESALLDGGFSRAAEGFRNESLAVAVEEDVVRWADAPDSTDAIIDAFGGRREGRDQRYTDAAPSLAPVLAATDPASARFARPLAVDSGPFEASTYLATGITPEGDGVRWRSAVGFEGTVPPQARERFRERYAELDGVESIEMRTDESLIVVDVMTTADVITSIQPL